MQNSAFEQEVLKLTNEFRQSNGLNALVIDQNLEKAADKHSLDMATLDFFSHTGNDGTKPWDRTDAVGYESKTVGENIAAGYRTPKEVVDGWINSPGHRANMLNPAYNEIGLGYYFLQNDTGSVNYNSYWTQVFGKGTITTSTSTPAKAKPTPTPISTPTPEPTFNNRSVINGTNRADKLVGGSANQSLYGRQGNDAINAGAGNDRLVGGSGDDKLFGEAGNDQLLGGSGKDVLQGSSQNKPNEKDVLTGGGGGDRFVLGDKSSTFYDDGQSGSMGLKDYALITDFNRGQGDVIQLSAKYNYRLGSSPQGVESGRALFIDSPNGQQDELIAVIKTSAQLNSGAFTFV
ncbi:MAG: CAP domain-containing protein [Phormidesmis sp.]